MGRNRTAVLEFAVLGLLHRTPMHGYELSKQLNMLLGTFRALSYGTLYPCLTKLYGEGLIAKEGDESAPDSRPTRGPGRSKIVYRLTAEGKERFQDLLIKVNTPGVIGIIVLQALAAAAAVAFFLRRRDMPRRMFLISSSLVAVGLMAWVIYMVVKHLDVLTGAPKATNDVLLAVVPAVLLLGVVGGLVLRSIRPDTIALLARDDAGVELPE